MWQWKVKNYKNWNSPNSIGNIQDKIKTFFSTPIRKGEDLESDIMVTMSTGDPTRYMIQMQNNGAIYYILEKIFKKDYIYSTINARTREEADRKMISMQRYIENRFDKAGYGGPDGLERLRKDLLKETTKDPEVEEKKEEEKEKKLIVKLKSELEETGKMNQYLVEDEEGTISRIINAVSAKQACIKVAKAKGLGVENYRALRAVAINPKTGGHAEIRF